MLHFFLYECLLSGSFNRLDKTFVHVLKLDKKETSAVQQMCVVVVWSLWLLCCVRGCCLPQCYLSVTVCSAYDRTHVTALTQDLINCIEIRSPSSETDTDGIVANYCKTWDQKTIKQKFLPLVSDLYQRRTQDRWFLEQMYAQQTKHTVSWTLILPYSAFQTKHSKAFV